MAADSIPKGDLLLTDAEAYFDQLVKARRWQGRKTYGGGLDHTATQYDWSRMALEEALDLGQYLAAEVCRLKDQLAAQPEAGESAAYRQGWEACRLAVLLKLAGQVSLDIEGQVRRLACSIVERR